MNIKNMNHPSNINTITLADLMSQDFSIWLKQNKTFGFDMHLEADGLELEEEAIHPYAMESFAELCRAFLFFYDNLTMEQAA